MTGILLAEQFKEIADSVPALLVGYQVMSMLAYGLTGSRSG
jgi:hypothetical protein